MLCWDLGFSRPPYSRADLSMQLGNKMWGAPHHIDMLISMSHSTMQTLANHLLFDREERIGMVQLWR